MPSSPSRGQISAFSRAGVNRNATGRAAKKSAGWGSNVKMALGAARSLASATARSMTA